MSLVVLLVAAACGSDDDAAGEATAPEATDVTDSAAVDDGAAATTVAASGGSGEIVWTAPSSGNSDDWVAWSTDSCSYVAASEHPDVWVADAEASDGSLVVGFGAQDTVNEVNISMNESMDAAASKAGVELAVADYKFPSTSDPISAAQSLVVRDPAVVVSNNQLEDLLDSVNEIFTAECIPVVQVVTASEGTVLFGPSNAGMGELEGARLVEFAQAQGWTADDTTLITTFYPAAGPEVALRASVCADVVKAAFPGISSVDHDTNSTTSLELQNNFTDVLTANPDATNILNCTVADLWALANAEALKVTDRHTTAAVTGVNGGSAVTDAIAEGDTALIGSVDLGAASWGDFWIPLAQDIAAGLPVPAEVYAPIAMLPAELPTR